MRINAFRSTVLILACLLGPALVAAQKSGQSSQMFFPLQCQSAVGTCCPSYNGQVCGGPGRGYCGDITKPNPVCSAGLNEIAQGVNGAWWLTERFTMLCMCEGNFWGADCSQCRYGWTGANCDQPAPQRVRQAFNLLTPADQQNVINAFVKAKQTKMPGTNINYFDYFAALHSYAAGNIQWAYPPKLPNNPPNMAHSSFDSNGDIYWGSGFPSWHRHLLLTLENTLSMLTGNASFALPYWNWALTSQQANPNMDLMLQEFGGNGQPSNMQDTCLSPNAGASCGCPVRNMPFYSGDGFGEVSSNGAYSSPGIRRAFGGTCFGGTSLPTPQQVQQAISISSYGPSSTNNGFAIDLEFNLHGTVHDWVGGSMMMLTTSASDPIFFMHHCYVDLIFEDWLRTWGPAVPGPNVAPVSGAPAGHNLYDCLGPFFPLVNHTVYFQPSWTLGYNYDVLDPAYNYQSVGKGRGRSMHLQDTGSAQKEGRGVHNVVMEGMRPLHCYDLFKDYDEEKVDCGGSDCAPC